MTEAGAQTLPVLVHAPFGDDRATLVAALERAELTALPRDGATVAQDFDVHCGGLVLTQEALVPDQVAALAESLRALPAWSAPQVTLLLDHAKAASAIIPALRAVRPQIATPVLLRPTTELELITVVRAGVAACRTQVDLGRTLDDQRQATEHARFLLSELHHRTQNLFAMIDALARQTVDGAADTSAFKSEFSGRIQALAATYQALRRSARKGAALYELIDDTVGALLFDEADRTRVSLDGPSVHVPESLATALALALHELATNARKYGALSNTGGRVSVRWHHTADGLRLTWQEHDGPPVTPPTRQGFGTTVIRQGLASAGAHSDLSFAPDGVTATFDLPAPDS